MKYTKFIEVLPTHEVMKFHKGKKTYMKYFRNIKVL